ncbi:protein-methionine-sulfoxide reductase catalytic subunit MsrP [Thioclava sp. GXIMD4216]|uniref:Protein-methionine-sulfoxide reductase catalytic subunit MsrP n=1 Tax=Thioclava litoralis TaxID=3076557 RepID=A0ABZ1E1P3_9RHOB|nr:protein-methionine-sulfoxide reductase catalytic subunit MsrP [Thioclava sp. FTW29]
MMRQDWDIYKDRDVTPKEMFLNRRQIMAGGLGAACVTALPRGARAEALTPNSFEEITSYNNFYEFGWDKSDPKKYAAALTTTPWSVEIDGLVERPGTYALEDLLKMVTVSERIYRFRCVEAWSMVIPWSGFQLSDLLESVGVQSGARYVGFTSVLRPKEMPGQSGYSGIDWPYQEGLRLDEAMNPLTLMATGLYGEDLPKQNGAPIRLVVPWKYGFKSAKSIVKISLLKDQPLNTWQALQPKEYGFYANVNPQVDHPRWSQATERVIGAGLFGGRKETLMFNGYGEQVASLYKGMDLRKFY